MAHAETQKQHIEQRPNRSGQPRAYITGTRVRVQDIYAMSELQGLTPDQIAAAIPHLTLGQVHAALGYYFDHREEIVEEVRQDEAFVSQTRAMTGPGPLEAKLQRLDADGDSVSS